MAPPVLGAVTGTWLKLALPLLAAEAVVLGGLSLSAALTLLIIPPLLSLVSAAVERDRGAKLEESAQPAE